MDGGMDGVDAKNSLHEQRMEGRKGGRMGGWADGVGATYSTTHKTREKKGTMWPSKNCRIEGGGADGGSVKN